MYNYKDDLENELLDLDDDDDKKTDAPKRKQRLQKKKRSPRNGSIGLIVLLFLLTITTLASVGLCFYILKTTAQKEIEEVEESVSEPVITYTQDELDAMVSQAYEEGEAAGELEIKNDIIQRTSTTNPGLWEMLRQIFPEYVVYAAGEAFTYVPVNTSYELNNIDPDKLVLCESGEIRYCDGGTTLSKMGIDVSEYQGDIDWEQVAGAGVDFAIIRLGYRGYGSGKLVDDKRFEDNLKGATENGIETGVYFFTQAISEAEIDEEVALIMDDISGYNVTGPIVIDIERIEDNSARGNQLTQAERTELVLHFCDKVREYGHRPMIYGNLYSLFYMLDIDQIHDEDIWFAFYFDYLYYPYRTAIWQYSDSMHIPGISGNVDIDIMFE